MAVECHKKCFRFNCFILLLIILCFLPNNTTCYTNITRSFVPLLPYNWVIHSHYRPLTFCISVLPRKHKHNCYCAQEVLSGLRQPVAVVHCGDGSQRLFVLEREGIVRILDHDLELIKEPFLDIHKLVQNGLKVGMSLPS